MEKDNISYIPEQSYLYFPTDGEQRNGQDKKMIRWIFEGNTEYTDFEKKMLEDFEKEVTKKSFALPDEWVKNKHNSLKFLHANAWNFDKAMKTIQEYLDWRTKNLPIQIDDEITKFLNSGVLYFHGRDHKFRPILVLNTYLMNPNEIDVDKMLKAITYFLNFLIEKVLLPGQVENWIIIQDLNEMGVMDLPLKMLKNVLGFLQNNFRARLFRMYALNCPSTITWGWKLVKPLMEETTAAKINFINDWTSEDLWKHIHKSQVEKKFGGYAENLTSYWPPKVPSNDYLLEKEKNESILIDKAAYKKRVEEGKISQHKISQELAN